MVYLSFDKIVIECYVSKQRGSESAQFVYDL